MTTARHDGRTCDQVRPITIQYDTLGYADASVLFELGKTKILVSVTLQQGVPPFLKGQRVGWLNAEYAMLPCATHQRTNRESTQAQRNARSVEISRLIGRSLRSIIDLNNLGERTIIVDCDVLQADGGTRVACITAASLALQCAAQRWHTWGDTKQNLFKEPILALSAGIVAGVPLVDLSYEEDSQADADFNFVMTQTGKLIELQGTSEKTPIDWQAFDQLKNLALQGIAATFTQCGQFAAPTTTAENIPALENQKFDSTKNSSQNKSFEKNAHAPRDLEKNTKPPLFSLGNRLKST
jgi:ribonuclease PH